MRRLCIAVLGLAGIGLVLTLASLDSAAQTGAPQLTVRVIGPGKVSSAPAGVDCQPDCSEPFPRQRTGPQVVTLTAVPGAGQELEAWGESCVGSGTCSVVMDQNRVVTARFRPRPPAAPPAAPGQAYLTVGVSYYVHLKTDTVPLEVGDQIGRGAEVGEADNTGRSCGPHLHFQSQIMAGPKYYGQTLRIRFNTWVKGQAGPYALDCYIPQKDDVLISTTG